MADYENFAEFVVVYLENKLFMARFWVKLGLIKNF